MKTVQTQMCIDNVKRWSVEQAVAEILQNALDIKHLGYSYSIDLAANGTLTVSDNGPGMQLRHLAFGMSEKDDESAGQFGRGLKQAMLVLLREGRTISLYTRSFACDARIVMGDLGVDTLAFDIDESAGYADGTMVVTQCTQTELDTAKQHFAALQTDINMVTENLSTPGGSVFINGVLCGMVENALYSYHLTGKNAQDITGDTRTHIDMTKLQSFVRPIIAKAPQSVAKDILRHGGKNEKTWESDLWLSCWTCGENWQNAFYAVFGQNACLVTDGISAERIAYLGYNPVELQYYLRCFLDSTVRTGEQIARENAMVTRVECKLTRHEQSVLKRATEYLEYKTFSLPEVKVAGQLLLSSGAECVGQYDRSSDTIWLAKSALRDRKEIISVILHELAHKESNASDCDAGFEAQLTEYFKRLV